MDVGGISVETTSAAPQTLNGSTARPFLKFKPYLKSDFFTNFEGVDATSTAATARPPFSRFKPFSESELLSRFQSGGAGENNLDMVLKFMTKDQILGTGAGAGNQKALGTRVKVPQGRPVNDLTLLSMGVQSDDDDAISAMMEMTEFGLKNDSGEEEQEEKDRQRDKSKAKHRTKQKNDNMLTRRRPRPSRPSPTATTSSVDDKRKPSEKFPHYPSKTPYGSSTEMPTSISPGKEPVVRFKPFNQTELFQNFENVGSRTKSTGTSEPDGTDDEDVLADLELDLQAELDAIRKLQDTIKDKGSEEGRKGNVKVAKINGKTDGPSGKTRTQAQRPMRTRRPVLRFKPFNQTELFQNFQNQATRPPAAEESEKDEMSHVELQKVKAPGNMAASMKTRRPGVATTSRRPATDARPALDHSDPPVRSNPFMRRNKRPRPTKITSRQPTAAPTTPPFVRFKPFSGSSLLSKPGDQPDSTPTRHSPPSSSTSTSTTTTGMLEMPLSTPSFGSASPPTSSSEPPPPSSTPFTRFNSERNPDDPSPTSFIRFEMMPHGPFFTSDLAEQSLADSLEEDDQDELAKLNLKPQRPMVSTIPSQMPRRPALGKPNMSGRPRPLMEESPDMLSTMAKMPGLLRPNRPKTADFTRPNMQDTSAIFEPEIPGTAANDRPELSSVPEFSIPILPKRPEMNMPDMSMPELTQPGLPKVPNFPMPKIPRPPMGMLPPIPSIPIPTRNKLLKPSTNGRPPMMPVPPRPRPGRPSISFVEMSRPTKSPPERPSLPSPTSSRPHSPIFISGVGNPAMSLPAMPHKPGPAMTSEMESFMVDVEKSPPERPSLLSPASSRPHSPNFMSGVGNPAMSVPAMPHKPGPAMTSEMESFMEDVENFTKRPLRKPNTTSIHFQNLLRPESQPSFEFAMNNLMSMFEPTKSTAGLKADAPRSPTSSFTSMSKRPFFETEGPTEGSSISLGGQLVGNSPPNNQSPINGGGDAGGGNFMSFRFGPEGGGDEEFEFSSSLDLLDLRPNKGDISTSTPHSTTLNTPSTMDEMPAFMSDEVKADFMQLMFESAPSDGDKSKRTTPRPFDNPYMNYFESEGDKSKINEAFDDEATPFTFSRRPTPSPFPTVEAFTVRMKPTGAPISLPTTPKTTLTPAFLARPSSKPMGGPLQFRGHLMKNKRPPTSSSSFRLGFAHRSTATPFHMPRPTRPKRKMKPLTLRPLFAPGTAKKPFVANPSKLDALRAKLQRLSKPKPAQTLGLPVKDISKPFRPSRPQFDTLDKRPPQPVLPFKMSPVDFHDRPRPLPPHTLKPIHPIAVQRPPPKNILPVDTLSPHPHLPPTRPKVHPFTEKRPTPAAAVAPHRPGVKEPFTVRPKSTIVPHNFVQPANIKKAKQHVKDPRPEPPPLKMSPPKHHSRRPRPPSLPPKPIRPHVPQTADIVSPKPLQPLKPTNPPSMLNDLKAPEPASAAPAAAAAAADFEFNSNIFDELSEAQRNPPSFDGPLFYGDANIKNLASPDRPPHKLRTERRPKDPPPPPPKPPAKDSSSANSQDDFDYLAALYDDYDHTLFPGQHDDRPPVSTFAPGFDNFPKFEDEKVGGKKKGKVPSPNAVGEESYKAGGVNAQIHGPIESLLRDLPHTGGTPHDEQADHPKSTGGSNDVVPSPATIVGSLPRPDGQHEPYKGGPTAKRPYFRPTSLVGAKPFQLGMRPSRNIQKRPSPHPITRKTPHPKLKLPKMDQELLGFISTIPGYMQKMMSNIGDNFTGRDLKAAVMRIDGSKRRHDGQSENGDYEYDDSQEVEIAVS